MTCRDWEQAMSTERERVVRELHDNWCGECEPWHGRCRMEQALTHAVDAGLAAGERKGAADGTRRMKYHRTGCVCSGCQGYRAGLVDGAAEERAAIVAYVRKGAAELQAVPAPPPFTRDREGALDALRYLSDDIKSGAHRTEPAADGDEQP